MRLYQASLAGLLGGQCRFYPSCSHYAIAAISRYGVWRGFLMSIVRLGKCHPWHPGGVDTVS